MSFQEQVTGPFTSYGWDGWLKQGVVHGFIGKTGMFRGAHRQRELACLSEELGFDKVHLLRQVHGDNLVDPHQLSPESGQKPFEADGWVFNPETSRNKPPILCGLVTADCLPVIIRTARGSALVHAGWRGVAKRIVVKALDILHQQGAEKYELVVGPAAGQEAYRVGSEVIESIGEVAEYKESDGALYLSLAGTVKNQVVEWIKSEGGMFSFHSSGMCTITDRNFHSHRRDGDLRGSNLTFLVG